MSPGKITPINFQFLQEVFSISSDKDYREQGTMRADTRQRPSSAGLLKSRVQVQYTEQTGIRNPIQKLVPQQSS